MHGSLFVRVIIMFIALFLRPGEEAMTPSSDAATFSRVQPLVKDSFPMNMLPDYDNLVHLKTEVLRSAPGTKSVIFDREGSRLYAMNLEGMSVFEYDRASRSVSREFRFRPTRGFGWDYATDKKIPSYEEKPVEAVFSHGGRVLWVSLHNAGGIVPIWRDSLPMNARAQDSTPTKTIYVTRRGSNVRDSMQVPLIRTGMTPKVMAVTGDDRNLIVSNWHSNNLSVLDLDTSVYPWGKVTHTLPVPAIPRGIVVDGKRRKTYVAIMGGSTLAVADNDSWRMGPALNVAENPRHIVMDDSGHIFVSYNKLGQVACVDVATGRTLHTVATHGQPRTISLSRNGRFLFVTCYKDDRLDVFKVSNGELTPVTSLPCPGGPVGIDIFEDRDRLEAWVCNYRGGVIDVFSFGKK